MSSIFNMAARTKEMFRNEIRWREDLEISLEGSVSKMPF